jgi:YVTN family beta-propeller protein
VLSADQGTADKPGHTVSLIDTAAMTVRGAVGTGSGPHGVVIDTSETRAWVTNSYENTVSVINLGSLSVVAAVAVGTGPSGISYSPRPPPVLRPPRGMSRYHPRTPKTTPGTNNHLTSTSGCPSAGKPPSDLSDLVSLSAWCETA